MLIHDAKDTHGERVRTALLAAARDLLERDGFEALTIVSAAEAADVTRDDAYQHFSSRSALVTALYREYTEADALVRSRDEVWRQHDSVSALAEWARHIGRSHPPVLAVSAAIQRARHKDPDAAELWNTTMRDWYASCTRLAEWLDRDGALAGRWTVATAADMLWGLTSWDLLDRMVVDRGWPAPEFGEQLAVLLTAALVAPAASTSATPPANA